LWIFVYFFAEFALFSLEIGLFSQFRGENSQKGDPRTLFAGVRRLLEHEQTTFKDVRTLLEHVPTPFKHVRTLLEDVRTKQI